MTYHNLYAEKQREDTLCKIENIEDRLEDVEHALIAINKKLDMLLRGTR